MARTPTQKEIAAFVVGHGIVDFVSGGKLSLVERNAIWKSLKKLGPPAARAAPRIGMTALQVGKQVALRHPVLTGGAIVYYTYKNREEIADLLGQGYDVIQDINAPMAERRREFASDPVGFTQDIFKDRPLIRPLGTPTFGEKPKRRKSTYNSAVSKGIKALKKSTSYGKRGVLNTPKKAFGFVARTVSKLRKGKKVPSKGASGVVKRALPGISKITARKP
jgi:hypothetical protein